MPRMHAGKGGSSYGVGCADPQILCTSEPWIAALSIAYTNLYSLSKTCVKYFLPLPSAFLRYTLSTLADAVVLLQIGWRM
jgi:hypothetical protein